jgi:hypothetical protein
VRKLTNNGQWSEDGESWISTAIKSFPRWPLAAS